MRNSKGQFIKGSKLGFQKGHPPFNNKLDEWRKNGGVVWNKGLPSPFQPHWQGGITDFNSQVRNLPQYKNWREQVFIRDNYTCQECGIRSGLGKTIILHADLIRPLSVILKENNISEIQQVVSCIELWDTSNGRTLCIECHKKTDTYLWRSLESKIPRTN